jgi:hypothetical protein
VNMSTHARAIMTRPAKLAVRSPVASIAGLG